MASLSEQEKREFLEDAHSSERRKDFAALKANAENQPLNPEKYLEFLMEAQRFMKENPRTRPPITGRVFKI